MSVHYFFTYIFGLFIFFGGDFSIFSLEQIVRYAIVQAGGRQQEKINNI
jgi:hypothetical protein